LLKQKTILIAPLDWGLGHATRCIPIITTLQKLGCTIIMAAEGSTQQILSQAFPSIMCLPLQGYHIHYSRKKNRFVFKILTQIPKIMGVIYKEQRWIKKVVKEYAVDAIISDNRFGCYHHLVPCVYITHQLAIQTGNSIADKLAKLIHFHFIKKYTQCWVPDFEGNENLAGNLSHPKVLPSNTNYIGCLSRFQLIPAIKKIYDLVIVISGPEPQRTIFENLLLDQLNHFKGKVLMVRGLPGSKVNMPVINIENLVVHAHLSTQELNLVIQQAQMVICRSGYTTVMDLIKLHQKAIMLPTPGQAEQEYLATYLFDNKMYYSIAQHKFVLQKALDAAASFPYHFPLFNMEQYKNKIAQFVSNL
jgi:uncharacterized protein (TIGR00661 family)